jgi:CheY-like chemotaxis protein
VTGGRVLVVDDTVFNRRLLVRLLGSIGHEALEAVNGLEALAILRDP